MQDGTSEPVASVGDAAARDWAQIIRRRLTGTQPRHDRKAWLMPGRFEGGVGPPLARDLLPAAVLIPLVERDELGMLFTQRATGLRTHAGQISFPGGRIEPGEE